MAWRSIEHGGVLSSDCVLEIRGSNLSPRRLVVTTLPRQSFALDRLSRPSILMFLLSCPGHPRSASVHFACVRGKYHRPGWTYFSVEFGFWIKSWINRGGDSTRFWNVCKLLQDCMSQSSRKLSCSQKCVFISSHWPPCNKVSVRTSFVAGAGTPVVFNAVAPRLCPPPLLGLYWSTAVLCCAYRGPFVLSAVHPKKTFRVAAPSAVRCVLKGSLIRAVVQECAKVRVAVCSGVTVTETLGGVVEWQCFVVLKDGTIK